MIDTYLIFGRHEAFLLDFENCYCGLRRSPLSPLSTSHIPSTLGVFSFWAHDGVFSERARNAWRGGEGKTVVHCLFRFGSQAFSLEEEKES